FQLLGHGPESQQRFHRKSLKYQLYNILWETQQFFAIAPYGAVGHGGHYHSQSPEAFFCHAPGIKVVIKAKGLLLSSIRDPSPVVFFEPKWLYRQAVEEVPEHDYMIPLSEAEVIREDNDITLVGWGVQLTVMEQACLDVEKVLALYYFKSKIIDLKSLLPWDKETVEASVKKAGMLLLQSRDLCNNSLLEGKRLNLEAPVSRVWGLDTPFPLVFEPFYMPTKNKASSCSSSPSHPKIHFIIDGILDAIKPTVNY
ncbi:hypothetical protein HID58_007104, partial [Brassica napus]